MCGLLPCTPLHQCVLFPPDCSQVEELQQELQFATQKLLQAQLPQPPPAGTAAPPVDLGGDGDDDLFSGLSLVDSAPITSAAHGVAPSAAPASLAAAQAPAQAPAAAQAGDTDMLRSSAAPAPADAFDAGAEHALRSPSGM